MSEMKLNQQKETKHQNPLYLILMRLKPAYWDDFSFHMDFKSDFPHVLSNVTD